MPKQISPIVKLKGKVDDLSFYKSQDGFMARTKGGVSAERLRTDPKFDQTRRAQSEFAIGGKAGKLFRQAWNNELAKASDNRVASRLTQRMVSVLKTDTVSDFGLAFISLLNPYNRRTYAAQPPVWYTNFKVGLCITTSTE